MSSDYLGPGWLQATALRAVEGDAEAFASVIWYCRRFDKPLPRAFSRHIQQAADRWLDGEIDDFGQALGFKGEPAERAEAALNRRLIKASREIVKAMWLQRPPKSETEVAEEISQKFGMEKSFVLSHFKQLFDSLRNGTFGRW
jgi:hypothetical protein